jgi:hypothetical protein
LSLGLDRAAISLQKGGLVVDADFSATLADPREQCLLA